MTKLQSLKQDLQFKEILREKKLTSDYFSVYFMKNYNEKNKNEIINISFVAKKKVGNAVKRNKIRRKLRAAFEKNLRLNNVISLNYKYLIFGKEKVYKDKFSLIFSDVNNVFKKIK